jgi:outer membrane protein assembly factor BamD (BamD/ComL family)
MAGKIFINYRRGDDAGHTGRLFDRLQDVFNPEQLFLDVDNIAPGLDFVRVLNERVAECDVVISVIGKGWLEARDAAGARRLDDPDDFVRIEITSALNQGKRVIPVLVGDAHMPRPEDLPEALRPLARRNAVRLTHERFRSDTQGLIKALQQSLEEIEAQRQAEAETARRAQAEEDRRRLEAEFARQAAEEERKRKAEQEAQERAAEERRQQEVAARRRAEEEIAFTAAKRAGTIVAFDRFVAAYPGSSFAGEAQKQKAALVARDEAQQRIAEERRRQETAAKQRAEEDRAFASAKRAGTVLGFDAFLAAYPAGLFTDEAQKLRALLVAREDAYRRTLTSNDPVVFRSFLTTYRTGVDVDQVRRQLRRLEPQHGVRPGPEAIIAAVLVIVLMAGAALYWYEIKSPPSSNQQATALAQPPPMPGTPLSTVPSSNARENAAPAAPVPSPDQVAWDLLKDTTDEAALKRFVAEYPDSPLRKDAEARIETLEAAQAVKPAPPQPDQIAWAIVQDSKDPDQLRRFIAQFPDSVMRADAEKRLDALLAEAAKAAPSNAASSQELARALQFELQRVGCFNGAVNGQFDDATNAAWRTFTKLTSITTVDELTPDAIKAVRGVNKRVCPLKCPAGQHAEGDQCIADVSAPSRAEAAPARPQNHPAAAPAPRANGKCFTFQGRQFCE